MPTVAAVSVAGESVTTGQICSVMACVPWHPLVSLTRTVMLVAGEADAVGVPEITPVLALRLKPVGSAPVVMVQELYGATPPDAVSVCE